MTDKAELIFSRTIGADKGMMAHVNYVQGNIQFKEKNWELAQRSFQSCLNTALAETPLHPITAAAYYSIACVEFVQGHYENAKAYLDKAKAIAQLRTPTRDDGVIARILWKTACVLESNVYGQYAADAADLRQRAEVAQQTLLNDGEGGEIPLIEDITDKKREEDSYDALVPLFFR